MEGGALGAEGMIGSGLQDRINSWFLWLAGLEGGGGWVPIQSVMAKDGGVNASPPPRSWSDGGSRNKWRASLHP